MEQTKDTQSKSLEKGAINEVPQSTNNSLDLSFDLSKKRRQQQRKDVRQHKNILLNFIQEKADRVTEAVSSATTTQLALPLEDEFFCAALDIEGWKREQLLATPVFYMPPFEPHDLGADYLKLLHFFLPYSTTLENNLTLLERCFTSFFDEQVTIGISETAPRFQRKSYPGMPLESWQLDAHATLAGEGFSSLPSVLVTIKVQDRSALEQYLPNGNKWKLLEQYLCPLFLAKNFDWSIKLVAADSDKIEHWRLDQENALCYLDINTILA